MSELQPKVLQIDLNQVWFTTGIKNECLKKNQLKHFYHPDQLSKKPDINLIKQINKYSQIF